eukprot:2414142-Prymnesium_polylepis.1
MGRARSKASGGSGGASDRMSLFTPHEVNQPRRISRPEAGRSERTPHGRKRNAWIVRRLDVDGAGGGEEWD